MKTVGLALLGLVLATAPAWSDEWYTPTKPSQIEVEREHNVQSATVTPHTAWARPYAHGSTRVLFFLYGTGGQPREVVELAQRFDLRPEMVYWAYIQDTPQEEWHGGAYGLRRMARLLEQRWDAFVFISPAATGRTITPELLPLEQQCQVLEAVSEGAGLVLLGGDDPRVLKDKNRLAQVPPFLREVEGAAAFSVLKGRGVRLPPRPRIEYRFGWDVDFDEWAMRVGKAVLWAAHREPQLAFTLTPQAPALARTALPGTAATLQWERARGQAVQMTLRREDGVTAPLPPQTLKAAAGSLAVSLPRVRAGQYYLDAIARDGQSVAGFVSTPLTVTSARQVDAVTLEPAWSEVGGTLSGRVALSGTPGPGEQLTVSLRDRRGRVLARQAPSAAGAFQFLVPAWFPMLVEVRATLTDPAGQIASAWRFANVVKRHRGRFNFVVWGVPEGNLAPWVINELADTGVTIHLDSGAYAKTDTTPSPVAAAYDMGWIPYTTHVGAGCQPACWADETAVQAYVSQVVQRNAPTRRHGVFAYSLGDEIVVRGSCVQPSCLSAYRRYLHEQYGDIAALNASWGSQYGGFDEVQLSTPTDNDEAEALQAGNFPRWYDRQAYQAYNFSRLCERFGQAYRALDPESKCGFEGAGGFGNDVDGIVRANTFWSPYPGPSDEVLRSVAPRDFPRANWMGYTKDADGQLRQYWRMVTRGCDSVWWWTIFGIGTFHGWLAPTLDPYPAVQELLRDTQVVRDGLGDLLLQSDMQTDGIGVMYSFPSAHAAQVQTSRSFGTYERNHVACTEAVRELGLNFCYFTDGQMRRGEVDLAKFKAIILPLTQAMGPAEAEKLRAYVRGGGLLIADVRPAIYDGHVKPLGAGQLDDVFGIRRTGLPEAVWAAGQVQVPGTGDKPQSLTLSGAQVDAGVQAAGAVPAGSAGATPLFLSNRFGQGRAVLLNLALSSAPSLGADATPELAAQLWRQTLAQGDVTPALALTDAGGQRSRGVEVTRWVNGPVQLVSLFRSNGAADATVRLPRACHVYDLKNRRDLGLKQSFAVALKACRAQFFALSPQPLAPVSLRLAPAVRRGEVQRLQIAAAPSQGRQAVRVSVRLPDGKAADWVERVAVAGAAGAEVAVPVAQNDPAGVWTVSATDVCSGKVASAKFVAK